MLHFINNHKDIANIKGQMKEMQNKIDRLHALVMAINDKAIGIWKGNEYQDQSGSKAQNAKPRKKHNRVKNSFADEKFARHFEAAMHWKKRGMKHDAIAERMNHANFRTPRGLQYTERHVSDLLSNKTQCKRFLTHIVKRS